MSHTPGPWKRSEFDPMEIIAPEPNVAEGHNVCSIKQDYGTPSGERKRLAEAQLDANADLIAAAPDLLAACKVLLEQHCLRDIPSPQPAKDEFQRTARVARAAIAKAEQPLAATLAGAPKKPAEVLGEAKQ